MRRLLPLVLLVAAVVAAPSVSAEQQVLDQPRHGADAVRALGQEIAAVARDHDTTAAELQQRLQEDLSLWVDVQGRLFYVDPEHGETTSWIGPAPSTSLTRDQVLTLHSKPSAARTVLLDVDGVGGTYGGSIGKAWNAGYTGGDGVAEPYSTDGNPGVFSDSELADIYSIWQRVAEDFAPFDVNVTTQEVGFDRINRADAGDTVYGTRVAITSTATNCGCGGVAYVGVFDHYGKTYPHAHYQPAFVYNEGAKAAAEAASHEAGHNLGLSHDGTASTGYYTGHGSWSPIMGVGYYTPISQWSRGEYSGADNPEDDFVVAGANGAPLRFDEAATALTASSTGIISSRGDTDDFTFTLDEAAAVTLSISPATVSPNLDVVATLMRGDGTIVAVSDPLSAATDDVDKATGLAALIEATLGAGSYTLRVDGVGALDPLSTGYSDYGSVGSYSIASTGITFATPPTPPTEEPVPDPPTAPTAVTATPDGSTVTILWGDSERETSYELWRQKKVRTGWSSPTLVKTLPAGALTTTDGPGNGTFRYEVLAVNAGGSAAGLSNEVIVAKTISSKTR